MEIIHESKIATGDRQREAIKEGPLGELKHSIIEHGLLHPIVLHKLNGEFQLVAGQRRLEALRQLHAEKQVIFHGALKVPEGYIPYVSYNELSEIEAKEIELDENLLRQDLTWQERAKALADLHALRQEQNPRQILFDTGREVSIKTGRTPAAAALDIRKATLIAQHLSVPEVKNAPNFTRAFDAASKHVEGKLRQQLAKVEAERAKAEGGDRFALYRGDLREEMPKLKGIDLIIADPPYGLDAGEYGSQGRQVHKYQDDKAYAREISSTILELGMACTAAEAHIFLFCDIDNFTHLRTQAKKHGWKTWRTPLIWHKGVMGHAPWASKGFRREYEVMLFAIKGGKSLTKLHSDIIAATSSVEREHAAQKPLTLYSELIKMSALPNSTALDPCCGSGVIFPAAFTTGLKGIGIELDEATHDIALAKVTKYNTAWRESLNEKA